MIPVCSPHTTELEKKYVLEALDNNWISSLSPFVERLENSFAQKIGVKHCIAVDSGWSALFLTMKVLGIRFQDEVILPTFTMIATANAPAMLGIGLALVDSEPNGNIDVNRVEARISPRTKAIIPVHIYGHPCDMEALWELADRYGLYIVEDAAEAQGAKYRDRYAGNLGDIAIFSLYANKTVTAGQGGMITTNNDEWAEKLRHWRAYDFHLQGHFVHRTIQGNHRLGGLQAAYAVAQVERMDELVQARRKNAEFYTQELKDLPLVLPTEKPNVTSSFWMYGIVTEQPQIRDRLMAYLFSEGIETRTFFFPLHRQKPYKHQGGYPVADKLGKQGLYLPSGSSLTVEEKYEVVSAIKRFFGNTQL